MTNFEWHSIVVNNQSVEYKTKTEKFYIRLESVDGAEVTFIDYKLLLIFAFLTLASTLSEQSRTAGIVGTIVFVVLYIITRKLTLKIHGGNVVIKRIVSAKDMNEAETFIDNLKLVLEKKNF